MRFALRLAGSGAFLCVAYSSGVSFAQSHMLATNDPIRAQLLTKGKPGLAVAQARSNVIEILQSKNSCSAWFQGVDPNAASTFASLKFIIETHGPKEVLVLRSGPGEMLLKHPYAAKAFENHAFVVLNANGAFFVRAAPVFQQDNQGGFYRLSGSHGLLVGSYLGNTRAAQMTILLHELGHVVGRIPNDSDELSGQSERNTAEVLRFCQEQIKAASESPLHSEP